ncbi:MAG: hypothetical protein ACTSXQ_07825 [Alphaproteobacteria bacterium]
MDRRNFLKGSVIGGAGLVLLAVFPVTWKFIKAFFLENESDKLNLSNINFIGSKEDKALLENVFRTLYLDAKKKGLQGIMHSISTANARKLNVVINRDEEGFAYSGGGSSAAFHYFGHEVLFRLDKEILAGNTLKDLVENIDEAWAEEIFQKLTEKLKRSLAHELQHFDVAMTIMASYTPGYENKKLNSLYHRLSIAGSMLANNEVTPKDFIILSLFNEFLAYSVGATLLPNIQEVIESDPDNDTLIYDIIKESFFHGIDDYIVSKALAIEALAMHNVAKKVDYDNLREGDIFRLIVEDSMSNNNAQRSFNDAILAMKKYVTVPISGLKKPFQALPDNKIDELYKDFSEHIDRFFVKRELATFAAKIIKNVHDTERFLQQNPEYSSIEDYITMRFENLKNSFLIEQDKEREKGEAPLTSLGNVDGSAVRPRNPDIVSGHIFQALVAVLAKDKQQKVEGDKIVNGNHGMILTAKFPSPMIMREEMCI